MKPRILVVGSSNTDMVTISDRLPKPGETVISDEFFITQGGKGANQAVAAARLGGQVTFVARLGDDDFARQAITGYEKDGIGTSFIQLDTDHPTGTAMINIDHEGENMIVAALGANAHLSERDVERSTTQLEAADVVLSQLEIPVQTVTYLAKRSMEYQKPFVLNPAPAKPIPDELISMCTYFIPNQTESTYYSNILLEKDSDVEEVGRYFLDKGADNVIITLGARGSCLINESTTSWIEAPKVNPVDTVGAGDVFCGAFSLAIAEGKKAEDAIRFANQCAAIAVTRKGAQTGIPHREEIPEYSN